jgi:hypothetical protein
LKYLYRQDYFGDVDGGIILKCILREDMCSPDPGFGSHVVFLGAVMNFRIPPSKEFLDRLRDYQLLKKDTALWR